MAPKSMKALISAFKSFSLTAALREKKSKGMRDAFGDDEPQDEPDVDSDLDEESESMEPFAAGADNPSCEPNLSLDNDEVSAGEKDSLAGVGQRRSSHDIQLVENVTGAADSPEDNLEQAASAVPGKRQINARKEASREKSRAYRAARRTASAKQRRAVSSRPPSGSEVPQRLYIPSSKHHPRSSISQKYSNPMVFQARKANLQMHSSARAWIGLRLPKKQDPPPSLHQLKQQRFKVHKADPRQACRDQIFVDCHGRISVIIVPPPSENDPRDEQVKENANGCQMEGNVLRKDKESWEECIQGGTSTLSDAYDMCKGLKFKDNARGPLYVLNAGINHYNGTTQPGNRKFTTETAKAAAQLLLKDQRIRRVAGYQNAMLHLYAPKLAQYYDVTLGKLYNHDPTLFRPFDNSIYPSVAFNIDPYTVCRDHTDAGNFPANLCAITAFGNYNYKLGGHLILYDLKLIIEIPPGYTVFIPSATLRHGNTPIAEGETRYSMVQYCPGGLLRWVEYGFMKVADLESSKGGVQKRDAIDGNSEQRWESVINLLSKISELKSDLAKCRVKRS